MPKKCHFKKEVRYLGHLVSEHGVSPDPDKVAAVANWEVLKTQGTAEVTGFSQLLPTVHRTLLSDS